jgi:hypothetical protein
VYAGISVRGGRAFEEDEFGRAISVFYAFFKNPLFFPEFQYLFFQFRKAYSIVDRFEHP